MTHCVRWGRWSQPKHGRSKERFGDRTPNQSICNYKVQPNRHPCGASWRIQTRSWVDLPQRFRLLPHYFGPCCIKKAYISSMLGLRSLAKLDVSLSYYVLSVLLCSLTTALNSQNFSWNMHRDLSRLNFFFGGGDPSQKFESPLKFLAKITFSSLFTIYYL